MLEARRARFTSLSEVIESGDDVAAVGERGFLNSHRMQDAEEHIRHGRLTVAPVRAMLQTHVHSAGNQRGEIRGIMRGTGTTAKQHDAVVQHTSIGVFELLKFSFELSYVYCIVNLVPLGN